MRVEVGEPGEAEALHRLRVDALQRAEALLGVVTPVGHPLAIVRLLVRREKPRPVDCRESGRGRRLTGDVRAGRAADAEQSDTADETRRHSTHARTPASRSPRSL